MRSLQPQKAARPKSKLFFQRLRFSDFFKGRSSLKKCNFDYLFLHFGNSQKFSKKLSFFCLLLRIKDHAAAGRLKMLWGQFCKTFSKVNNKIALHCKQKIKGLDLIIWQPFKMSTPKIQFNFTLSLVFSIAHFASLSLSMNSWFLSQNVKDLSEGWPGQGRRR